jgi:hypothetical protein
MSPEFWLGVVAIVVFALIGLAILVELEAVRVSIARLLGSQAEAAWRIRDELKEIGKGKSHDAD